MYSQIRKIAQDLRQRPKLSLQKKAELLKIISGLTRLKSFAKEGQDVTPLIHQVLSVGPSKTKNAA